MIEENCTPALVYCELYSLKYDCFTDPFWSIISYGGVFILYSYPYGHEELAVCEDIDQVCFQSNL